MLVDTAPDPQPAVGDSHHQRTANRKSPHVAAADTETTELSPHHELQSWERPGVWGTTHRCLRNVQRFVWDDPDKPKEEKWFLFKLDLFLLTSTCLGYFTKGLDQANLSNAYVSGMREALGLEGSQLTYAGNLFTAGYVIGSLPAVILSTRVRPSLLIPTLELLWTILTFCTMAAKNAPQLYGIRFLVGLCESAYFPLVVYVIGSWYTHTERGKRLTLFYCVAALSQMFSGYLQAGAYKNLSGRLGHEGWQWLFIICGCLSLPIALIGYAFIPDFPETTRAFYITAAEADLARDRLLREGLQPIGGESAWDRRKIFRIMAQWQFWVLPLTYFAIQAAMPVQQPTFALWLKATGHTVYEANVWPTGQPAIGVVVQLLAAQISDSPLLKGRRWQTIIVLQLGTLFGNIVLSVWDGVGYHLRLAAFLMLWFAFGIPALFYAWFTELIPHDHEMRGFVIAWSNTFSFTMSIWYSAVVWKTAYAPRFHAGFIFSTSMGGVVILAMFVILFFEQRDKKRIVRENEVRTADLEKSVD